MTPPSGHGSIPTGDPRTRNELEACCHLHPGQKNHYCMEIGIPKNDPFYRLFGFDCIDFIRGFPGVPQNCALGECWCCLRQTISRVSAGPRNQFNILTGVIDGNTVYGGNDNEARNLRAGVGGLLRTHDAFHGLSMKHLLPLKTDVPDEGCIREHDDQRCFLAGKYYRAFELVAVERLEVWCWTEGSVVRDKLSAELACIAWEIVV
ncbi:Peroxidasin [Portunus trituberculatus]|uniref:Peroxidasin n=1 Tax=Portunus trituberculatus TaxID=210409 RepID=A0A5B7GR91_PORTR|nr:Peroxidasin [Portunus trituberculatus]